jgi:hypothetical protein
MKCKVVIEGGLDDFRCIKDFTQIVSDSKEVPATVGVEDF